jgi:hypothetical protein
VYHLDYNAEKMRAIEEKYREGVLIEVLPEEDFFLLSSRLPDRTVEQIAAEFELEPMREYFERCRRQRETILMTHGKVRR